MEVLEIMLLAEKEKAIRKAIMYFSNWISFEFDIKPCLPPLSDERKERDKEFQAELDLLKQLEKKLADM